MNWFLKISFLFVWVMLAGCHKPEPGQSKGTVAKGGDTCAAGYFGKDCVPCPGVAEGKGACFGHGSCHDGATGDGACECAEGYDGASDCAVCVPGFDESENCTDCILGYYGKNCENTCSGVAEGKGACFGHGTCDDGVSGDGSCACAEGYDGASDANCSQCLLGFDIEQNCQKCLSNWNGNMDCTQCATGYYGANCEPCPTCVHGGSCASDVNNKDGCSDCNPGWAGPDCNECAKGYYGPNCVSCPECVHGGTCYSSIENSVGCVDCNEGWAGPSCETALYCNGSAGCSECVKGGSDYSEAICKYVDTREGADNKEYPVYKIGGKFWLGANMAYDTGNTGKHYNPGQMKNEQANAGNVATYGLLYDWEAAKAVCPTTDGWRLPEKADFDSFLNAVGKSESDRSKNLRVADFDKGADTYGFGALPAGYHMGSFPDQFGISALFWSSTLNVPPQAFALGMNSSIARLFVYNVAGGFSVRCLKD